MKSLSGTFRAGSRGIPRFSALIAEWRDYTRLEPLMASRCTHATNILAIGLAAAAMVEPLVIR